MTTDDSGGRNQPSRPAEGPGQASLLLTDAEESYRLLLSTDGRH